MLHNADFLSDGARSNAPLLSICIPTFNRRDPIKRLVADILTLNAPLEICVHVDGSTDGTLDALRKIAHQDERLVLTSGPNRGRAAALRSSICAATGKFSMIYDDDDNIYLHCLQDILVVLDRGIAEENVAGFIFSMDLQSDQVAENAFPVRRSNFIKLRADENVRGDRKEIVLSSILKPAAMVPAGLSRRVPTSLIWARVAIDYDVYCMNINVGKKNYLEGGMTANLRRLQRENPYPLLLLHLQHISAFRRGRYRSPRFLVKSIAGSFIFGSFTLFQLGRNAVRYSFLRLLDTRMIRGR
ncbi:glycosyltransferase family 2 protein [Mesorhizobium sp.]|uniref:glycosyltransferase family 2 protein n=1 Tax=Mesorhizobium sp. TaxID=1871066 RepID=UPI001206E297|nr:glycosyltransferase family 2 protein [Mesorhizobium sp.]TIN11634.1 MAG: glycosyltransferase family 2 protein [Mesorhizobium sp.]